MPERPAWLGPTPFNSYEEYGPYAELAWYGHYCSHPNPKLLPIKSWQSLHDTHRSALAGGAYDLEVMRCFYLNLATLRLTR